MNKLSGINFSTLENIATPTFGNPTFGDILTKALEIIFPIAGLTTLAYLIYGGYQYMMSYGDPKAAASAMRIITYAVVGFVVLVSSFIIMNVLGVTLALPALQNMF